LREEPAEVRPASSGRLTSTTSPGSTDAVQTDPLVHCGTAVGGGRMQPRCSSADGRRFAPGLPAWGPAVPANPPAKL